MTASPTAVVAVVSLLFVLVFFTKLVKPTNLAIGAFFAAAIIVSIVLFGCAPSSTNAAAPTGDVQAPYLPWGYNIRNEPEWQNKLVVTAAPTGDVQAPYLPWGYNVRNEPEWQNKLVK